MSKGNGWIGMDKMLAQDSKSIRRSYSRIEAMFFYSVDADNGKKGTISGYSKQWGWSRNKVRRFLNSIKTEEGHLQDSKRTGKGHPIHFIDNGLMGKKDRQRTDKGHLEDTTNKPNPKPKEIYSRVINYLNKKTGKKFKPSARETKSKIDARLNDGYKPEDFKTVIDNKVFDYHSGDFEFKYLRPETLFGNKFEGYLNQSCKPVNGASIDISPNVDHEKLKEEYGI